MGNPAPGADQAGDADSESYKAKGKGKGKGGKGKKGKNSGTGNRASKMQNGKTICKEWNNGNCTAGDSCPDAHVCNISSGKNGRVCGMRNHKASEHTNNASPLTPFPHQS